MSLPLGRVATLTQQAQPGGNAVAEKAVDFLFDDLGRPEQVARYADLVRTKLVAETDYLFDDAGRLTDLAHQKAGTTFADYDLVYDRAGQLTDFDFTALLGPAGDADYTHDATGSRAATGDRSFRSKVNSILVRKRQPAAGSPGTDSDYAADWQADEAYQYDDNGNRDLANGAAYETGPNNQP